MIIVRKPIFNAYFKIKAHILLKNAEIIFFTSLYMMGRKTLFICILFLFSAKENIIIYFVGKVYDLFVHFLLFSAKESRKKDVAALTVFGSCTSPHSHLALC